MDQFSGKHPKEPVLNGDGAYATAPEMNFMELYPNDGERLTLPAKGSVEMPAVFKEVLANLQAARTEHKQRRKDMEVNEMLDNVVIPKLKFLRLYPGDADKLRFSQDGKVTMPVQTLNKLLTDLMAASKDNKKPNGKGK
jgi:hypothetical protein